MFVLGGLRGFTATSDLVYKLSETIFCISAKMNLSWIKCKCQKKDTKKQTPTVSWHPWALVAAIVRFMSVSDVKKRLPRQLIVGVWVSFGKPKAFCDQRCKLPRRHCMDFEQRKQPKPCDDRWVREHKHRKFHCSRLLKMAPGRENAARYFSKLPNKQLTPPPPPPPTRKTRKQNQN